MPPNPPFPPIPPGPDHKQAFEIGFKHLTEYSAEEGYIFYPNLRCFTDTAFSARVTTHSAFSSYASYNSSF
jgi:hypothetical protein